MGKQIPDRWMDYGALGNVIPNTRFVAFKVPLNDTICQTMAPSERFTPLMLIKKKKKMKIIIDLTNTRRYYNPKVFEDHGIKYFKIFCRGHEIPNKSVVTKFYNIVDNFTSEYEKGLIGVHCTHGVNRTGYLICKYMIQRQGIAPKKALKLFQVGRGHKIERIKYTEDLMALEKENHSSSLSKRPSQNYSSPLDGCYDGGETSRRRY